MRTMFDDLFENYTSSYFKIQDEMHNALSKYKLS